MTPALRVAALTALAMLAFAANSVLNRLALAGAEAGATGFAGVRLAAGAVMLGLILLWRHGRPHRMPGSWAGAAALACYALAFSVAYLSLGAATGALVLFASVQAGMLAWAVRQGDRPGAVEWAGFALAMACLALLLGPGLSAPDPAGAALMALAGLAWAAYSVIGRGSTAPLPDTAGNFLRCLPLATLLILPEIAAPTLSPAGWGYAIASGAIASGLGYAVWYAVLPALSRGTAAYVQLTVPAIAAAGGVAFLAEPVTPRLALSTAGVLAGVAIALWAADRRRR
jgi:drug/metabolite transporter (DMT)-like permease